MVSYQLLVFGIALVFCGGIFAFFNDVIYDLSTDDSMAEWFDYSGPDETFQRGKGWMTYLFEFVPAIVFISGGIWLVARAMKG